MCPVPDSLYSMKDFLNAQKKGSVLTAKDHIARLLCLGDLLLYLAAKNKTDHLIKELRGFRADTSWLIHQLEQGKCKTS